jgi:hypothetical protein
MAPALTDDDHYISRPPSRALGSGRHKTTDGQSRALGIGALVDTRDIWWFTPSRHLGLRSLAGPVAAWAVRHGAAVDRCHARAIWVKEDLALLASLECLRRQGAR